MDIEKEAMELALVGRGLMPEEHRTKWFKEILTRAFSAGEESMRERAAKECDDSCCLEQSDFGAGADAKAESLARAIRSLPLSNFTQAPEFIPLASTKKIGME